MKLNLKRKGINSTFQLSRISNSFEKIDLTDNYIDCDCLFGVLDKLMPGFDSLLVSVCVWRMDWVSPSTAALVPFVVKLLPSISSGYTFDEHVVNSSCTNYCTHNGTLDHSLTLLTTLHRTLTPLTTLHRTLTPLTTLHRTLNTLNQNDTLTTLTPLNQNDTLTPLTPLTTLTTLNQNDTLNTLNTLNQNDTLTDHNNGTLKSTVDTVGITRVSISDPIEYRNTPLESTKSVCNCKSMKHISKDYYLCISKAGVVKSNQRANQTLVDLKLSENLIGKIGLNFLSKFCSIYPLKKLDLSFNSLGNFTPILFKYPSQLTRLNLSGNFITTESIQSISEYLKSSELLFLDLSFNHLDERALPLLLFPKRKLVLNLRQNLIRSLEFVFRNPNVNVKSVNFKENPLDNPLELIKANQCILNLLEEEERMKKLILIRHKLNLLNIPIEIKVAVLERISIVKDTRLYYKLLQRI